MSFRCPVGAVDWILFLGGDLQLLTMSWHENQNPGGITRTSAVRISPETVSVLKKKKREIDKGQPGTCRVLLFLSAKKWLPWEQALSLCVVFVDLSLSLKFSMEADDWD